MKDKAIELEATKIKFLRTIEKMKEVGLKTDKYESEYNEIMDECLNIINNSSIKEGTVFSETLLENAYINAKSKLNLLYIKLEQYEVYIKISSFANVLKSFVEKENKSTLEFDEKREILTNLLFKLHHSNTLDYYVEGDLVNNIYELTYKFIKEEIRVLGVSPTIKLLKDDEINRSYLDKEILKDYRKLDITDSKYRLLLNKKEEIDAIGFNSTYLDEDFISLLVNFAINEKYLEEYVDTIDEKSTSLNEKYAEFLNKKERIERIIENYINDTKDNRKKVVKNLSICIGSAGLIAALFVGTFKVIKRMGSTDKYKNVVTTYTVDEGINIEESYSSNKYDSVKLTEYSPYEKNTLGFMASNDVSYTRDVVKYDLTNIGDLEIEEYLEVDPSVLGIKADYKTEKKDELALDDLYENTIREVTKTEVDTEDITKEVLDEFEFKFWLITAYIVEGLFIAYGIAIANDPWHTSTLGKLSFALTSLKKYKGLKRDSIEQKKQLLLEMKNTINDNMEIFNKAKELLPIYEQDERYQDKSKELHKSLEIIDSINNL